MTKNELEQEIKQLKKELKKQTRNYKRVKGILSSFQNLMREGDVANKLLNERYNSKTRQLDKLQQACMDESVKLNATISERNLEILGLNKRIEKMAKDIVVLLQKQEACKNKIEEAMDFLKPRLNP